MGKTRTKIIDDSQEKKPGQKKQADSLVAKLREELGITPKTAERVKVGKEEVRGDGERGSSPLSAHSDSEDIEGGSEPAGPRAEEQESGSADRNQPHKKVQKPGKQTKIRSKKYLDSTKDLDRSKIYALPEAIDTVKKFSYSKFDGTLEIHINTASTGIRGLASLPFTSGKKLTILAFGKGAEDSGADIIGTDEIIEQIGKGKINFDVLITTPEWMLKLSKVAKNLGPRGLMPNPKNGTITQDLKKAVEGFQTGKTEYKTESKAPIIHLGLGKLNQPNEELEANIKSLLQTLGKSRVKKVTLSPTMGPGVKLDLNSI